MNKDLLTIALGTVLYLVLAPQARKMGFQV